MCARLGGWENCGCHGPVASVGVVRTPGCEEACFRELPELKGLGKL